jgi:biopolymer transport protein ExbB/TolQ
METNILQAEPPLVHATRPEPRARIARPQSADLPLHVALGAGAVLTAATHFAVAPFRAGYLGSLLLERGWIQYGSMFLAWTAIVLLAWRGRHAYVAHREIRAAARLPGITPHEASDRAALGALRDRWIRVGGAAGLRRARALQGYLLAGTRTAASTAAEDDTAQAEAALDGAYAVPRVAVWAIPLFGFIGTVVGISEAVAGFAGFLQQAEEIEQIKQGIGGVTTGLAVAFDTTLLALALSVAVMLPLVILERLERRAILALDADTQDHVVAHLPEPEAAPATTLDEETVRRAVEGALANALPSPEAMVRDARAYLESAAAGVARSAQDAAAAVAQAGQALIEAQVSHRAAAEREAAESRERLQARDEQALRALAQTANTLMSQQAKVAEQARSESAAAAARFGETVDALAPALQAAAQALAERTSELAGVSAQVSEALALEQSLQRSIHALQRTGELQHVLGAVETSLQGLRPALERLALPRTITLVEADGGTQTAGSRGAA